MTLKSREKKIETSKELKLVAATSDENDDELYIHHIPGGPSAFEICAKFCYGMTVTLNAYNVVAARCAAEYLEMHETIEKGNLIYKIEVFLNSSIFRSWKDSIIVLQTTKFLMPWCEDLKLVSRCIDSITSKASVDTCRVDWSYTYNRKKLASENGIESEWNGVRKQQLVPKDWWVEDLCELELEFYKRVIVSVTTKGRISCEVIGEALRAYASRRLPGFSKGLIQGGDTLKNRSLVETIVWLLPMEAGSLSCNFLLKLLKAASMLDASEMAKRELVKRIGQQLEEASVADLLMPAPAGEDLVFDVDVVHSIVEEFVMQEQSAGMGPIVEGEVEEVQTTGFVPVTSKLAVAKLLDGYLAEIARDPNLPLSKFIDLAEMVSSDGRPAHDGLYRAIDMYLKEHPGLSKSDKKRICRLMDCRKLSMDACMHAAQNERLPLRTVVQVLFFEQVRAAAASGGRTPDLPGTVRALLGGENGGSHGSSRSATTNTEEEWEAVRDEFKSMRLVAEQNSNDVSKNNDDKGSVKMKGGIFKSKKILNKLWSSKTGENSSSDTSESPGSSANPEETKSTPSRNRRHSVS
ncbi:BTB/POZ domain-containing protein npy2 [Asimina triloba]